MLDAPLLFWLLLAPSLVSLGLLYVAAREWGAGHAVAAVFVLGWAVLVLAPLVWGVFASGAPDWAAQVGSYDFAGALPFHLGVGTAALMLAIRGRRFPVAWTLDQLPWWRTGVGLLVVWVVWVTWLSLMELDFDQAIGRIISATGLLSASSLVATLVVQRMRTRTNTPAGLAIGLVSGLAAATAACAFLDPVGAMIAGTASGLVAGSALTSRRQGRAVTLAGGLAVSNLSGGAVGLLMIGLLDRGRGFMYTGAPNLPVMQLSGVLGAMLLATVVCLPLTLLLFRRRRDETQARDEMQAGR